ncbi:PTS system mannose/fructose/N-acetylgalactosamine-transporter subunit IIB [Pelosinus fermentans]|uniref:Protein-N(Pi)-phosphohistidine--sugar phosphotransferase n=1 Tax=Pelosinus fermentans JBW45 TaxID=1192197 RepID=I8TX23_9FIRM|nr:PTS sugar transporter subunit IIB [Pelosinus fermentans]AJQ28685.1 Protein-N(pi)-phosphohistidine--sugar phosphotransferase [Pelosinus fermentans JBW45]
MGIELVRIDDRLIHGQIVMAWCKTMPIERIVVIDDEVALDFIRKMLLETVAPPGINVTILNVTQGVESLKTDIFAEEKLLLLVTNPTTILNLVENGLEISKVNIGGMSFGQGKTPVTKAVSISDTDKRAFKELHEHGIDLQIQILPHDTPLDLMPEIN